MKAKTKSTVPTLSRASQKTFIIAAALAFVVYLVMIGQYVVNIFSMQFPDLGSFIIYPATALGVPILSFLLAYVISGNNYTKLWRVCQAAIVAFLAMMVEGFLSTVNTVIFRVQLGYVDQAAIDGAIYLQLIPLAVVLALVAVASVWLRRQKAIIRSHPSPLVQKGVVILLPLATLGQMLVMYLGFAGSTINQTMDAGALMGMLTSLVIPAVLWAVLFLLTSRTKTTIQRAFTSLIYVLICVFIFMACMAAAYLISSLGASPLGGPTSGIGDAVASILALVVFIGLVAWHKKKQLI